MRSCEVLSASSVSIPIGDLRRDVARGVEGWPAASARAKRLAEELARPAGEALAAAGARRDESVACIVQTGYGFGHVAELIDAQLADGSPTWIDPELFIYYAPHVVAAIICMRFGLAGEAATLLEPRAGVGAVVHAMRLLLLGRAGVCVCGAYDVPTPLFRAWIEQRGDDVDVASAAFVVLAATGRGGRRLAAVEVDSGTPASKLEEFAAALGIEPSGARLCDLALPGVGSRAPAVRAVGALADASADGANLVVAAEGTGARRRLFGLA